MRITLLVVGALLVLVGVIGIANGVLTLDKVDDDGWMEWGPHPFSTNTGALVFRVGDTEDEPNFTNAIMDSADRMRIIDGESIRDGVDVFIGIAEAEDVEDYLAGTQWEYVTETHFEPHFETESEVIEGGRKPAEPGSQTFWIQQAHGTEGLKVETGIKGGLRVVVMNADASPDVEVRAKVGVRAPWIRWFAVASIAAGIALAAGGAVLAWNYGRRPQSPA